MIIKPPPINLVDWLKAIHAGDEVLTGTVGADSIDGWGGNDIIFGDDATTTGFGGHGGNDTLTGGAGNDTLYGDAYHLTGSAYGGNDTLWADAPNGSGVGDRDGGTDAQGRIRGLFGDAFDMVGTSHGGNDHIYDSPLNALTDAYGDAYYLGSAGGPANSSGGDDYIQGLASTSHLYGDAYAMNGTAPTGGLPMMRGGNDTIDFYSPFGAAYGDAQVIQGFVQCGDDTITAHDNVFAHGVYGATLIGDAEQAAGNGIVGGNDWIQGDIGNDTIYGDFGVNQNHTVCGNDTIIGGAGNDRMWGDNFSNTGGVVGGADTFVFAPGSGQDTIMDFDLGSAYFNHSEGDVLDVSAYHLNPTIGAGGVMLTDEGGGAVVHLSATDQVTLMGVRSQDLTLSDFRF